MMGVSFFLSFLFLFFEMFVLKIHICSVIKRKTCFRNILTTKLKSRITEVEQIQLNRIGGCGTVMSGRTCSEEECGKVPGLLQ